ncbi:cytochrome P450 [Schizothecium vesticola]|uniref:Cytochrome P450 monooxygenase ABA1 n=1 Tax=Schizothecium vesticola TaxID=314040 RepID=A0AA40BQX4_9PEZI|nr:cytochrome P450 [Schizothecium vesticola]
MAAPPLLPELYEHRWLGLAVSFIALYVGYKIQAFRRLSAFGGPFGVGFTSIPHSWSFLTGRSHLFYKEAIDAYGPIARIGPNDLVTSSPELLAHMSAVRSSYSRGKWYNRATRYEPGKDHVFSELDEEKHKRRRQQMAHGYSGKENLSLESSIDTHVSELINLVHTKYLSTDQYARPFDFARKIQYFTLDVISQVGFGEAFGDLLADEDVNEYVKAGQIGLTVTTVGLALGITWFLQLPLVARALGPSEKDVVGFGRMIANARALIRKRLERETDNRSDMLASFVRNGLNADELLSETVLQIIAGSDTTAAALRAIMLYLLSHPRIYTKLQAEIDAKALEGRYQGVIPDSELRKLPYLQAVIKEGMRMHPPITDSVPKRVPDGGDTVSVDGKSVFLPGGALVSYAAWPLHHSKAIFGDDAGVFRPERWLVEKDEKKMSEMNRTHELNFGYGKYQCLGKPIALMEIGKAVFELLRNFDWCLGKPEEPWREHNYMGIFVHSNMWVMATERTLNN